MRLIYHWPQLQGTYVRVELVVHGNLTSVGWYEQLHTLATVVLEKTHDVSYSVEGQGSVWSLPEKRIALF